MGVRPVWPMARIYCMTATNRTLPGRPPGPAAQQSYGKLVAYLAARTRDVAAAEMRLPYLCRSARTLATGSVPEKPEAGCWRWRGAGARRCGATAADSNDHLTLFAEAVEARMTEAHLPDERLLLMFTCAHPAIGPACARR